MTDTEKWAERGIMLDLQARAEKAEAERDRLRETNTQALAALLRWEREADERYVMDAISLLGPVSDERRSDGVARSAQDD